MVNATILEIGRIPEPPCPSPCSAPAWASESPAASAASNNGYSGRLMLPSPLSQFEG